jgi:trimethylamine--corrinoid protein Co-methyltransferase
MAAAAQIAHYYQLPGSVGAGMTDAKMPDNQAGFEKGISVALAALAGGIYISEVAGMLASLIGCSFEAIVIDNDMLGVPAGAGGIEVGDDAVAGRHPCAVDGLAFPGRRPDISLARSEYLYPKLADRSHRRPVVEGHPGAGRRRVRAILSSHYPVYLDRSSTRHERYRSACRRRRCAAAAGGECTAPHKRSSIDLSPWKERENIRVQRMFCGEVRRLR